MAEDPPGNHRPKFRIGPHADLTTTGKGGGQPLKLIRASVIRIVRHQIFDGQGAGAHDITVQPCKTHADICMTWDMQKFVIIKMAQSGDIIAAGKFDCGFYVFNLAPFNGLGTSIACLPIIWRGVCNLYIWVFFQLPLRLWIWEIQKQIEMHRPKA